jgi:hypothetical protein
MLFMRLSSFYFPRPTIGWWRSETLHTEIPLAGLGRLLQLRGCPLEHDPPLAEHKDAIGQRQGQSEVLLHKQEGQALLLESG